MRREKGESKMNLCSEGHEEVCYEGRHCPACEIKEKLEAVMKESSEEGGK